MLLFGVSGIRQEESVFPWLMSMSTPNFIRTKSKRFCLLLSRNKSFPLCGLKAVGHFVSLFDEIIEIISRMSSAFKYNLLALGFTCDLISKFSDDTFISCHISVNIC